MRKLYRNQYNAIAGGVCAGLADYFNIDLFIVRLMFIISFLFFNLFTLIIYLIMWMMISTKI